MIAPGDATRPRLGAGSFVRLVGPHFGSDPLKQTRGTLDTPAGIREHAITGLIRAASPSPPVPLARGR